MSPDTQTAYTNLTSFNKSAPTAQSIQEQTSQKYNIGGLTTRLSDLQTGVNNLQTSLNNVNPSVTGRLQGNFATTAQRDALIAKEQAPIAQNLATEDKGLQEAQTNLTNARTEANTEANAQLTDQAKTYQQLLDTYNAANARDQFAATQALEQAKLDEMKREANIKSGGGSGYDIGSLLGAIMGGGNQPSTPQSKAGMTQRSDGGFNFTDANGNAISAAQYAKGTGTNFRDLLTKMASAGDKGAKTALGFVGNDFGYDPNKIGNNGSLYNALVGGIGRSFTGSTQQAKQKVQQAAQGSLGLPIGNYAGLMAGY